MTRSPSACRERSFFVLPRAEDRSVVTLGSTPCAIRTLVFAEKENHAQSRSVSLRNVALALLGTSLGAVGMVAGVSYVQASDRLDMYETTRFDAAQRQARRTTVQQPVYTSTSANSYAPGRGTIQPLGVARPNGMLALPAFQLNPFNPVGPTKEARRRAKPDTSAAQPPVADARYDSVSGASDVARTICVRLCDGYQHPIGHLRDQSDLPGHEALCKAMFPDVPTRVFRVAAGAVDIDNATTSDGKTYRSLPMAYAYQTSIDPACARPRTGAQTVSLMRDFTLRAGDVVMVNGRPRVFNGASNYPFTTANFRDFRQARTLSSNTRRDVDRVVGVTQQETLQRQVRRASRIREANAADPTRAIDVVRGGVQIEGQEHRLEQGQGQPRTSPRIVELPRR